MDVTIFDLDNCLADDEWRIPRINWSADNVSDRYAVYHTLAALDKAKNLELVNKHTENSLIIIFTARPECYRQMTVGWLYSKGIKFHSLFMRPDDNYMPSSELKQIFLDKLKFFGGYNVVQAYDDKEDVVAMFRSHGVNADVLKIHNTCAYTAPVQKFKCDAASILDGMADTYRDRNRVYGDNYKMVGKIMAVLFPDGASPELLHSDQFHLMELKLVKLSRFAISGLTHIDSIHDDGVYSAMIESILTQQKESK